MSRRAAYLHSLVTRQEVILLPLATSTGDFRSAEASLPAVYQPLVLRPAGAGPHDERTGGAERDEDEIDDRYHRDPDDLARRGEAASALTVDGGEEALARSPARRMVVLGGPGTGKTTLLRALVSRAARRALEDPSAPLPISVDLPDLAEHGADLRRYLPRLARSLGLPEQAVDLLAAALDEGAALVCLDGLDEVAPARRGGLLAWLASLGSDRGAWVIGSRFTQYRSGDLGRGVFTEWQLGPLDDGAQRRLAERLLGRLAPPDAPAAARDVDRFLAALERHPQASSWRGVPLLFSLTAAAWAERGSLPESRASLYRLAVDALVASRTPDVATRSAQREAMARVALWLFRRGGRSFTREATGEAIGSGLLEPTGEAYRFGHQTLHEYLAAAALAGDLVAGGEAGERAWALAWSKRAFSRWSEPLRLMVGVLVHELGEPGARKALAWLGALAAQRDGGKGDPGDLALGLAVRSLAEVGEPPASWPAQDLAPIEALLDAWTERALDPRGRGDASDGIVDTLAAEVARLRLPARQRVIEPLGRALTSDPDARRREAAAKALMKLGAEAPLDPLVTALRDPSPSVRETAVLALRAFADLCPPGPLLAAMREADEWMGRAMGKTLAHLGDRAPVDELVAMLRDDDANIRIAAAEALLGLGTRVPLAPLVEATKDPDWHVRDTAVRALGRQGDRAAGDEAAIEAIFAQLTRGDRPGMRMSALAALRDLGERLPPERWVGPVLAMLDDDGSREAAERLASLGERAPFEQLVKRLDGKEDKTADAAVRALISLGQWVPIDLLVARLDAEEIGPQVRALRVLGAAGERAPVERMVAKLSAESLEVRAAAARALGKLGERAPVKALVKAARGRNAKVRTEALVALARLGKPAPIEVLVKGVEKLDLFAQQAVVGGIARAGGKLGREALLAVARQCETAEGQDMLVTADRLVAAASRCTDASLLLALMRDPEPGVRGITTELLRRQIARGEAEEAIAALVEMVEHPEPQTPAAAEDGAAAQPGEDEDEDETFDDDDDEDEEYDNLPPQPLHEAAGSLLRELGARTPDAWLRRELDQVAAKARAGLRTTAVQIAAAAGEVSCVPHVLELVQSEDADVQELAIEAASSMLAHPALPAELRASLLAALMALLTHARASARQQAAWALRRARTEETEVVSTLWRVVMRESSASMQSDRLSALEALRELGAAPDVDVLVKLLGDDSVGEAAATWLGALGEAAPALAVVDKLERALGSLKKDVLSSKHGDTASHALRTLGALGERAPVEPLLDALECSSMSAREAAADALSKLGARAPLERLTKLLASGERHLRPLAATALAGRSEPEALRALEEALRDPEPDVRKHAAWALDGVGMRAPELLPVAALVEATCDTRSRRTREWNDAEGAQAAAVRALSRLGVRAPREALEALAATGNRVVRVQALFALAALGPGIPVEFVEKHLGDHDPQVRATAARILASLGDRVPAEVFLARADTLDGSALAAVAKRIAPERSPAARAALGRWLSHDLSVGRAKVAEELAGLPPGCLDDLVPEMRALALDRWSGPRAAGLAMLAAHAPAVFEALGRGAGRLLAGEPPEGALREVALQEEIAALASLPRWPEEAWGRALEALAAPLAPLRALAASTLATRSPVPDRALRALWSLRTDPAEVVRAAVDNALARILSREGGLEDDEA